MRTNPTNPAGLNTCREVCDSINTELMRPYLKLVCGLSVCGLGLVISGCGDNPSTTGATATAATPPAAQPQTPASQVKPVVIPESAASNPTATLDALTQALRKYAMERRGLPTSFSEMETTGYVRNVPPAPSGKQYAIDAKACRVVLVNK